MNILVFNCGSSSINYKVYKASKNSTPEVYSVGKAHRVGVMGTQPSFLEYNLSGKTQKITVPIPNHQLAARLILDFLKQNEISIDVIGHRFVHGGNYFQKSAILSKNNLPLLEACLPLASIHNPNSMSVIKVCMEELRTQPEYVTFDTTFHASLQPEAYLYLLPKDIITKFGYRKYGIHGLSYAYILKSLRTYLTQPIHP